MDKIEIDKKSNASLWTIISGSQPKYYKDGYWYKIDSLGKESLAEQLTSEVLMCSNIKDYVIYKQCEINGKLGCKSASFLSYGERFISFQNLYESFYDKILADKIREISEPKDRLNYICNFIKATTGLDVRRYMQDNLALDMLIKNPDRHFGNLGLILSNKNEFRVAPIFDNGQGLYQNYQITPPLMDEEEKDNNLCAATICSNFELQALTAGINMKIDYDKLYKKLSIYPDSIAKKCLLNQLKKYEPIFSMYPTKTMELEQKEER